MNQYITANHYRRYPFVIDATVPFGDAVLVDARLVLSTDFGVVSVVMTSVTRSGGISTLVFTVNSSLLGTAYTLSGTIVDGAAADTRVLLALKDGSSVPRPDRGYGVIFIGSTAGLVALGNGTTGVGALTVDPSTYRRNVSNKTYTLRVGNMFRPGPANCAQTDGSPAVISLQNRVATVLAGCVEVTTAPSEDITQERMVPDVKGTSTTPVAVPHPGSTYTAYPNGSVTTITTHPTTINDAIPTSGVDATVAPVTPSVTAGHNARLSGSLAEKLVSFGYKLNGGTGMDCGGVQGYTLGTTAGDCVKSVNGVSAADGLLQLAAGAGVSLVSDQAGHRILVLINAENLTRAQP